MYGAMLKIRLFEEKVVELFQQGLVCGAAHVCIGQEAVAVGACLALEAEDYITSTHRGHGHCLAKGGDPAKMMAELLGRSTGYCKGKGGSMHIADFELGIYGANGIVGGSLPISVGLGLASLLKKSGRVILAFFGDGAANQGSFHEALNLASLWKVPVVYLCENNQYAVSTPVREALPVEDIACRASSYGIEGKIVEGNDCEAVYWAAKEAVEKARSGLGPSLIECRTYRRLGHYVGDPCKYRPSGEAEKWAKENDPLLRMIKKVKSQGTSEDKFEEIKSEVSKEISQAVDFALKSPFPAKEEVRGDVFVQVKTKESEVAKPGKKEITYREALNEALIEEMERDERVFLLGEDIALHGGAFQVTKGLLEKFGKDRVRNTPISEAAIAGCAIGAALSDLRPVAEIMYLDFTTLAMDQIVNQAAKLHYMFGGQRSVPLVIRVPGGSGGRGNAAQHSQSLEAWFMHVPGLKVIMPSTPYDAKGLLKTSIRDEDPVLFIEHKVLYNTKGEVPEEEYVVPLGLAEVKREGDDLTVIATSRMVLRVLAVAERLATEGINIEVIDPRTLVPLDIMTIVESVKKTGRVLIVEEDCRTAGVGAEILAQIVENAFDYLDAPVVRLAGLDVPIPYSTVLEKAAVPSEEDITQAIRGVVNG